ncbi:MAG: HAMP domain-containing histidine kinase, partial [Dinghuibacter sp.]|nr:HAMP domain-containing histidine kinase [Dinghuibacter sp.]
RVELPALVNEIQGVYQFYARSKSVQIVSTVPDHVSVMADRQMIKVVLRNLVSNAIKFSTAGTKVTIQAVMENDQVSISVADEGQGIAPEILTRILKGEEITTKGTGGEYGSGLGLNLCREFIEKHNSRLQVSSIPGKGSIFSFLLPVLPVETSVVQPAAKEILKPVAILRPVNGKPGRE